MKSHHTIDLAGTWSLALDPNDAGIAEGWSGKRLSATRPVQLPGSLQAQGIGDDVTLLTFWTAAADYLGYFETERFARYRQPGRIKSPCWLQPEKYYAGAAWYEREIEVPGGWDQKQIVCFLERPHWQTRLWIDGVECGAGSSLSTPHVYPLPARLAAGRHRITLRIDNRMIVNVGPNAHSVSDHTQGNWNGIAGRLELQAYPQCRIAQQDIFPRNDGTVRLKIQIQNALAKPVSGCIKVSIREKRAGTVVGSGSAGFECVNGALVQEIVVKLQHPPELWSEFLPALHEVTTTLEDEQSRETDTATALFGFREFSTDGTQFVLNGRKTFIRGTLECCIFPLTGYPPTDVASWRRLIKRAQAYGLNTLRFHSWCPPEAAFIAGDEAGMYFQIECGSWANQGASLGDGAPLERWLYDEGARIVAAHGNHPCFMMMAYGNEPGGENHKQWLSEWVAHWRAADSRRLHTGAAGWPALAENHYHNLQDPRIQQWGQGLNSRINASAPETCTDYRDWVARFAAPVVSHEIGQWCAYPDFESNAKFTGVLKAKYLEIYRDFLAENHMGGQARDFVRASGKLQVLCYKEEIESALRTPGFGGFHLLDLHDFPGQGSAPVGVLDAFWESKGYVSPGQYRRFCNTTVLLARLTKRYWAVHETFAAEIEIAHFGPAALEHAVVVWKVIDENGGVQASGRFPPQTIPLGNGLKLGTISAALGKFAPARKYSLVAGIEASAFENDWDFWVFPQHIDTAPPAGVTVVKSFGAQAQECLRAGGKVLLLAGPSAVNSPVAIGFSTVFWNTACTNNQPPHTLGLLCDAHHAAFAAFPAEGWSNWQWWELVHGSAAMVLDTLPAQFRPLVQPIDTWFEARRLGLLLEARVGKGLLMISSMDLETDLDRRIVARQMRASVLAYMASGAFVPRHELTIEQAGSLFSAAPASV